MEIKKFKELSNDELKSIIKRHFNHWSRFNSLMSIENTEYKFSTLYTTDNLPIGLALVDNEEIIGFCVIKKENLKKYPDIFPWLSDVMIFEEYRGYGYGKILIEEAEKFVKNFGFDTIYVWTDQVPEFYEKMGYTYKQKVEKNEGGEGLLFYKNI